MIFCLSNIATKQQHSHFEGALFFCLKVKINFSQDFIMKNEIKLNGKQTVMGVEIPVIEGGFDENSKCVTDKMIAEIHGIKTIHVRENINKNLSRFREGIDYIDMKKVINATNHNLLLSIGYTKMQISKSDAIYLLSERGYAKLIKIMDSDKAWEIHDILMDEYFSMRKTIRDSLSVVDLAMLKVMKAKNAQERMIAMQEYNSLVVQPLQDTIDKQHIYNCKFFISIK